MDYVTLEYRGDVAVVGLNRPQKRNAISDAFIEELDTVITEIEAKAKDKATSYRRVPPCKPP